RASAAAQTDVYPDGMVLTSADGSRGLRVSATGDPVVTTGSLVWRTVIPARSSWTTELLMRPLVSAPAAPAPGLPVDRAPAGVGSRRLHDWRRASTRIDGDDPVLARVLRCTETDLGALRIETASGLSYIAAGAPWFMTLFGRDSLLTGWLTLPLNVSL